MSKYGEAIKLLESNRKDEQDTAQRIRDGALHCSILHPIKQETISNYTFYDQEDTTGKWLDKTIRHIELYDFIINSIRTNKDRDIGCKWCRPTGFWSINVDIPVDHCIYDRCTIGSPNYCPMCGRLLKGEKDG